MLTTEENREIVETLIIEPLEHEFHASVNNWL